MTNFTINAENVKRLQTLSGQSKDLISLTKPIFCPSDGNLSVNLYSSRVTMSFSIDISNFTTTDQGELNYFSMSIDELQQGNVQKQQDRHKGFKGGIQCHRNA